MPLARQRLLRTRNLTLKHPPSRCWVRLAPSLPQVFSRSGVQARLSATLLQGNTSHLLVHFSLFRFTNLKNSREVLGDHHDVGARLMFSQVYNFNNSFWSILPSGVWSSQFWAYIIHYCPLEDDSFQWFSVGMQKEKFYHLTVKNLTYEFQQLSILWYTHSRYVWQATLERKVLCSFEPTGTTEDIFSCLQVGLLTQI